MFCHLLFQDLNYLKILNFNFPLLSEPCPDLLTPGGYRGKVVLINFWHITNESSVIARISILTHPILPVSEHIPNNTKPNNIMQYMQYQRISCNTKECHAIPKNTMQYMQSYAIPNNMTKLFSRMYLCLPAPTRSRPLLRNSNAILCQQMAGRWENLGAQIIEMQSASTLMRSRI